jgi:hypothetical protein
MWKNISEPGRPQMKTWRMRIAWWIPKTTNTRSEYVTLIVSTLQQWLHESASVLRYTYIACLVNTALLVALLWLVFTTKGRMQCLWPHCYVHTVHA